MSACYDPHVRSQVTSELFGLNGMPFMPRRLPSPQRAGTRFNPQSGSAIVSIRFAPHVKGSTFSKGALCCLCLGLVLQLPIPGQ
jgi:hypothetical protein